MAYEPTAHEKPPIRAIEVRDSRFVTFHFCSAPAGHLSKVLGTVTVEAVNDPTLEKPDAFGILVADKDRQPLVAIVPGNVLLAVAAIVQILNAYGLDPAATLMQAQAAYEVI